MKTNTKSYDTTWGTPIGRDCIDLHSTLAQWLGERLVFLADHTHGYPPRLSFDEWTFKLRTHGHALLHYAKMNKGDIPDADERAAYHDAQNAMMFVTRSLGHLWD